MTISRLTLARDAGLVALPDDGLVAFFNASPESDGGGVEPAHFRAVQGFKPDHDRLAVRGLSVSVAPDGRYAAVHVQMPRAKALARVLLEQAWRHCEPGGLILVDGQKTDGIDGMAKDLKKRLGHLDSFSKAHGKLLWVTRSDEDGALTGMAPDWTAAPGGFTTAPGVFSAEKIDAGSRYLLDHMPDLKGQVVDFGAGWGFLSAHVLKSEGVSALDLIEADHAALDCARSNVGDPRAAFHWADATVFKGGPYDAVVMNPPFHVSRAAEPDLGRAFIRNAAANLHGAGALWMVANRQLPYEATLEKLFRRVTPVATNATFKIINAQGPRRTG
ncbi:MAG: class I SAM-dependent methyltransferase [Brevirhabdus sp.]